jgi:hypothetical protein
MQVFLSKVRLSIRSFLSGPIDRLAKSVDVADILSKRADRKDKPARAWRKLSRRETLNARLSRGAFDALGILSTLKSLNQLT